MEDKPVHTQIIQYRNLIATLTRKHIYLLVTFCGNLWLKVSVRLSRFAGRQCDKHGDAWASRE